MNKTAREASVWREKDYIQLSSTDTCRPHHYLRDEEKAPAGMVDSSRLNL